MPRTATAAPAEDDDDDLQSDRGDAYERHRNRMRTRAREEATDGRDIGKLPPIKNKKRRDSCERDLRKFLVTYLTEVFCLEFSEDHERIIKEIETKALYGGLKAIAMPRGSGKTSILLAAAIWVLLYGHRRFVVLIEADGGAAVESMDVIKITLETNELLLQDFPEVCVPLKALDGITQRANGQLCNGELTRISWKKAELILPTIKGSKASGATIRCRGITARIRGMQKKTADGKVQRPDFVIVNDPQTDATARSEIECHKRDKVISGAILGLGGPGKTISGFAAVTVIIENDSADRLLNRKLNPKWNGDRCKLVYQWPTNKELWDQYLEIRAEEIENGDEHHPKATKFYRQHRKAMDEGAIVGWPARKCDHELSAIQNAYGLQQDYPDTFDAEYQNEPKSEIVIDGSLRVLSSDEYCLRVLPTHKRGELPLWVEHLNLGVDVQEDSLWYVVLGSAPNFQSIITDYGIWPDQGVEYATLETLDRTIARATKIKRPADAIVEALRQLTDMLWARQYTRDDGSRVNIERGLIDSGHRQEAIYRFCQETTRPVMPCKGEGIGAKRIPWEQTKVKPGEKRGLGYKIPPTRGVRIPRHVMIDTNRWKTFLADCFANEDLQSAGSWSLFKASPVRHRMIADNLSAEFPTKTQGRGRTLYEWTNRPGRDNHLLDAAVYAGVAAAMSGCDLKSESAGKAKRIRRKVDMAAARQQARSSSPGAAASSRRKVDMNAARDRNASSIARRRSNEAWGM